MISYLLLSNKFIMVFRNSYNDYLKCIPSNIDFISLRGLLKDNLLFYFRVFISLYFAYTILRACLILS